MAIKRLISEKRREAIRQQSIRLKEVIEDPEEPPIGEAILYLKKVDGKRTFCIRSNNQGGDPDIVEIAREV